MEVNDLQSTIDPHKWTPKKNIEMQKLFNKYQDLVGGEKLKLDGVYGPKTSKIAKQLSQHETEFWFYKQAFPERAEEIEDSLKNDLLPPSKGGGFLAPGLKKFPMPGDPNFNENKQKQWDYEMEWIRNKYKKK